MRPPARAGGCWGSARRIERRYTSARTSKRRAGRRSCSSARRADQGRSPSRPRLVRGRCPPRSPPRPLPRARPDGDARKLHASGRGPRRRVRSERGARRVAGLVADPRERAPPVRPFGHAPRAHHRRHQPPLVRRPPAALRPCPGIRRALPARVRHPDRRHARRPRRVGPRLRLRAVRRRRPRRGRDRHRRLGVVPRRHLARPVVLGRTPGARRSPPRAPPPT